MMATTIIVLTAVLAGGQDAGNPADANLRRRAMELAHKIMIVDTHQDTPYRLRRQAEDISQRTACPGGCRRS